MTISPISSVEIRIVERGGFVYWLKARSLIPITEISSGIFILFAVKTFMIPIAMASLPARIAV